MITPLEHPPGQSKVIRLIHAALVIGVVLFGLVTHFVVRPPLSQEPLPPIVLNVLLGVGLAAAALGCFGLRGRVPRRSTTDSSDLYWTTAITPALLTWAALEGGGLLSVVAYMMTGALPALAVAAINVACMLALRPGQLERA